MSIAEISAAPAPRWRDIVLLLLRLGLAVAFIAAAIPKILAPDLFALNVFNYHMLPNWGVNAMAMALPWIELFAGLALGLGFWRRASALTMAAMLAVFIVALVSARARGLEIDCGCFAVGQSATHPSMLWDVLRDVAMLVAALVLVRYDGGPRPLDLVLWRSVSAGKRAQA